MEKLVFKQGISEKQIEQLVYYSNTDVEVIKNTNDKLRFKSRESFEKWNKIKRKIYTLTNSQGVLLGIIWFRAQGLPNSKIHGITFAIRLYGTARGKGHAKTFLEKALKEYKKSEHYLKNLKKGIWLETKKNNLVAIKTYKKFGFIITDRKDDKVIMTRD